MTHSNTTHTLMVAAVLGALCATGCKQDGGDKIKLPPRPSKTAKALSSAAPTGSGDTMAAKASPSGEASVDEDGTIRLTGTTAARQQSAVAAEGMGKLMKMHVHEGDIVKKGQLLANLDASSAALRLKQAKAALAMAKVQLKATERERKRLEKLAAEGAVAGQKLDEVTSANEGAVAGVAQAEAMVSMASKAVGDSVVRSPFAGLVVKRLKAEGEWVSTMPPSPIILLAQIEPFDLTIQAPEHLLRIIKVGDAATAKFEATGQEMTGTVTRVVPVIMPPGRSFTVIIEIPNEDHALKPGVFAEVQITPQAAAKAAPEKKDTKPVAANEGAEMKIAEISIRRPVLAGVMNAVLLVVGLVALPAVGIDMFPDVDFPVITVTTVYPGADPGAVESKVIDKLEEPINTIGGIRQLQSFCLENVGQIVVMFELEQDVDQMAQEVRDKVALALPNLPTDVEQPVIAKFDVGSAPIISLALAGERPLREVSKYAEDVIKTKLQQINGVGSIDIVGGRDEEVSVWVDPTKLASYYLTVNELAQALGAQNLEVPGGRMKTGGQEFAVKTKGEVRSAEELGNIVITSFQGAPIRVRDVARIEDGTAEERSASDLDGTKAVAVVVRKQSGANTVTVAHKVKDELAKIRAALPEGMTMAVPTDNSLFIEASVNDAQFDLLLGAILTVIIIMFFLRDWRATIIAAVALPTSVIATVGFIYVMGYTFNMITMMALTLSIGMLIDDAIVVIENIHRHLEMGKTAKQAAYEGTAEIGLAVMAITASILAVFLPVANMKGMVGQFFVQFGMTVSFAVAVSLLVSFTVTPMLSSRVLKSTHGKKQNFAFRGIEWFLDGLDVIYRRVLGLVLRQRALTVLAALGVFVGSIYLASRIPQTFMPPEDRGEFKVFFELPSGTSIEQTKKFAAELREDLAEVPGLDSQFTSIGAGAQGKVNKGDIYVNLVPGGERAFTTVEAIEYVRELIGERPPAILAVSAIDAVGGDSGFRTAAVQFNIRGSDLEELNRAASAMADQLRATGGYVDLDTTYRGGNPELSVTIDRDRAAELGVPIAVIAMSIRTLIAGAKVTDLPREGDRIDVRVRVAEEFRQNARDLTSLKVRSTSGQLVELSQVVKVTPGTGPGQIDRQARQRQVTLLANLEDKPLGTAMNEVNAAAEAHVPAHLTTGWGGEAQFMSESFNSMFVALGLAVVLIYMLLAAQFESLVHPFTIMLSLPLSAIGAFGALAIFGHSMSIFSMIGFIMLIGLVTKNAVLLVDYTNTLRSRGMDKTAALLEAGPVRLRPILMTTMAMIFGMLPVAIGSSLGGEMRSPMAIAVIGGLITSTVLTLLVVPAIYSLLDRFTLKKDRTADESLTTSPASIATSP